MNYLEIFKIKPGNEVPGGRSYPVNATSRVILNLRDEQGNELPGREISKGDELTVIDVGYTRQLALVQYPAGGVIRQGYATARFIDYKNQGNYHNGSTPEPVINYDGSSLGSLDPYETATKLFEVDGLTQVVYNTDKGTNTKSGFVRYGGGSENVVHVDIPYPNVTNAELIEYGTSGKGRALRAYKMGNGRNSFIFNCEIHGWEDHWAADGIELTKIGNQLIEHFQNHSTGDFTLYVIPSANPDGVSEGWTENGPGRCTIAGAVDCNRDFPIGFSAGGTPRNHSGSHPLSVPESRDLESFIRGVKGRTSGETYLIDMHGWEGSMVGDSRIGRHFTGKLGLVQKGFGNPRGFLVQWSNSIGIISSIMELPSSIYSHADVVRQNCAGKIIDGLTEIMGTTGGESTSGDYNGHIKSGIQYVNIRTVPTTANNTPIGKLYGDNPIKIIEKTKASDGYYWYKFEYNGGYAYVREDFVTTNANIPVITEGGGNDNGDLKIGSRGDRVKDLQSKLAYVGLPVSIDGVFGEETAKYVKEFQKAHGLYVDGIVGNQTMKKLDEEVKKFEDIHSPTKQQILNEINTNFTNEVYAYNALNIPSEKVLIDTGVLKVTYSIQLENDIPLNNSGYKLQFINGNLAGVITPQVVGPEWVKSRLTNIYGKPGNGTFFDIQKVLELGLYKNKQTGSGNEYELDFEVKGTSQGLIEIFTYEIQHFPDIKYQNFEINILLAIEINLNKLITPEEVFAFAYDYERMMERVDSRLQEQLQIIGNKSRGARALSETSILTHSFLFTDSIQDPELKRLVRDILDAVERGEKNLVQYYKKTIDYLRINISDVGAIALAITAILWILFKFRFKEELSPV